MLRLVMACALMAFPLAASAQSQGEGDAPKPADARTDAAAPLLRSGIQTIPKEWQASQAPTPQSPARPTCSGANTVGGFCLLN